MKLLITGILGNIGNELSKRLEKEKIEFLGLDVANEKINSKKIISSDITNLKNLLKEKKLKGIDTVIHLASKINNENDVTKIGLESIDVNIKGTINLVNSLPNLKNMLFASSYMVYGIPLQNSIKESHKLEPENVYGISKAVTEKYLQVLCKEKRIELTIFRLMGIYGFSKNYTSQAIPIFINKIKNNEKPTIFGNGNQKRNHLYVDDAIDAIITWLKNKKAGIFNVGGVDTPTNLELISLINKKMGKKIQPVFVKQEQYDFIADISNMKKVLKFTPRIKIKDGINKTVDKF
jgi:UDP-glucose 4-epimerase